MRYYHSKNYIHVQSIQRLPTLIASRLHKDIDTILHTKGLREGTRESSQTRQEPAPPSLGEQCARADGGP